MGRVTLRLGGGRATKESLIDPSVGLVLKKKTGDYVEKGESLAAIHAANREDAEQAARMLRECYVLTSEPPEETPFIKGIVK